MRECPQCLSDIAGEAEQICPTCGASLAEAGPPLPPPAAAPAAAAPAGEEVIHFKRQFEERALHLPEYARRRAQEILAGAQMEMRRATVLMVDLRDYSRLGRELAPEALAQYADQFFDICTRAILRRGGFVVDFMGDAVLAVFGAPVAFDQDTESAVHAALDIREQCGQAPPDPHPMRVRVGIATGSVQSGVVESPMGKVYDIVGNTVNLAARLQGAAETNEILVCDATDAVIRRVFETEPTPPLALKNISEAYVAFRVLRERERPEPLRRFSTPLCGRGRELQTLMGFLGQSGPGVRVAHISGEAGMGKSRLVHEALQRGGQLGAAIWWVAAPSDTAILFAPVLRWLRGALGLQLHAAPEELRAAVRRRVAEWFPGEEVNALLLEYMFGVPSAIEALHGTPPERLQSNLLGLLRAIVLRVGGGAIGRPILVVDDAQWLDPLTARFVRLLAEWPEPTEITLVVIHRSGSPSPIPHGADHLAIALPPLGEGERQALLRALVPTQEFLPEIRELIVSRAAGNPLFIEEMTRVVREVVRNNAQMNRDALANHIVEVIPVTLHELIQSRIDRLDTRTRQVLQCASLLGIEFSLSLIEMFDMLRDGLAAHLHALLAMRYLDRLPAPRDVRYLFTHGLFRDVAYATLLEDQRRALHAALARRLEEVFADRLGEYHEILAFHFARGGEPQQAVYHLVKAADRQAGLGGAANALDNYQQAIELLRGLPATPARTALMARVLTRCGRLQRALGDGQQAAEMLGGALDAAQALSNAHLALEARLEQAITQVWRGEGHAAREALASAQAEAARLGHRAAEAVALNSLGVLHWHSGEFEQALSAFQRLATIADAIRAPQIQADALNNAGLIYWRWGEHTQALRAFKRALPLRRQAADHFGLCATLMNIAIIHELLGQVRPARRSYENARVLAERTGHVQGLAALEANLSNLDRRAGLLSEALEHALRAADLARRAEDPHIESIAEENAGLARLARGEHAGAREHLRRSLALAEAHGATEREVSARLGLLETDLDEGAPAPDAVTEINALLGLIERHGFKDLLPRAYRVKGRVLDARNDRNALTAREYLEMARDLARGAGNFFEEVDALRCLIPWARRHGRGEDQRAWEEALANLTGALAV